MKLQPLATNDTPATYNAAPDAAITDTTEVVVKDADGEQIDAFDVQELEDDKGNFYFEFALTDGTMVTLREPTGNDRVYLQQIAVKKDGNMPPLELLYRMISRLCVGWGEQAKVSPEFFMGMSHRKLRPIERRLEAMISHFFRD